MSAREACGGNPAEGLKFHGRNGLRLGKSVGGLACFSGNARICAFHLGAGPEHRTIERGRRIETGSCARYLRHLGASRAAWRWLFWYNYALMADEPPMTAWAEEKFKAEQAFVWPHRRRIPTTLLIVAFQTVCREPMPLCKLPCRLFSPPGRTIMLFGRGLRQIYTDGRTHPTDSHPLWMGHSMGSWDGDTFVVDTVDIKRQLARSHGAST